MSGNPFDDLAKEVAPDDPEGGDAESTAAGAEPGASASAGAEAGAENGTGRGADATGSSDDGSLDGPTLANSSPPFPYSNTEQKQMYVQDGLWDEFEDLGFDAEHELRRTFDVRNVEQRELDTAVVRLILDRFSAEEIAEMVVRTRGFDPSDGE